MTRLYVECPECGLDLPIDRSPIICPYCKIEVPIPEEKEDKTDQR